ncbi:hypothetical protein EON64_09975 [archaeon]|nr:MAG: hypothetical protein EON64_09975 [archaeon]
MKLSDNVLLGSEQREAVLTEVKPLINKSSLLDFQESPAHTPAPTLHLRYPKTALAQRLHTFVPGSDAYKEASRIDKQ